MAAAALFVCCAAGGVLRLATLDGQSFWFDEAVVANRLLAPGLGESLEEIWNTENTPPLWYAVAWVGAAFAGEGEVALRSTAALAGVLTVGAGYLIGRELGSARTGLLLAAFVSVQPFLFWYSQEARSYAFYALFSALAFWVFLRALRTGASRDLWGWAAASVAAMLSHFFALFGVAAMGIWLVARNRDRVTTAVVGVVGAIQLAFVPVILRASEFSTNDWIAEGDLGERVSDWLESLVTGRDLELGWLAAPVGIAAMVLIAAAIRRAPPEDRRRYGACLWVAGVASLVPLAIAPAGADYFLARNVLAAVVPLLAALALAATRAPWPLGAPVAAAVLAAGAIAVGRIELEPSERRAGFKQAVAAITASGEPGVLIGGRLSVPPILYYLDREPITLRRVRTGAAMTVQDHAEPRPAWLPAAFRRERSLRLDGGLQVTWYRAPREVWVRLSEEAVTPNRGVFRVG